MYRSPYVIAHLADLFRTWQSTTLACSRPSVHISLVSGLCETKPKDGRPWAVFYLHSLVSKLCSPIWELSVSGMIIIYGLFRAPQPDSSSAIQISWLCFCYPCLLLAYIGQAAFISDNPEAYSNPFFNCVPPGTFWPSLILSILASIVASQAIITSTFQLLAQVMNMSYFPQIKRVYTSSTFFGQVYVPMANWLLMIGTVIVTAVYNNVSQILPSPCLVSDEQYRLPGLAMLTVSVSFSSPLLLPVWLL